MSDFDRNSVRWGQSSAATQTGVDQGLRAYMMGVYNNMMLGLAVTGIVAYATSQLTFQNGEFTQLGQTLYFSPIKYLLIFAPFAFVLLVQYQFRSWSLPALRLSFYAYAAMVGVSTSILLIIYSQTSIANAFFITATAFGACSFYGYVTKRDLSALGSFCIMGLWGALLAGIFGIFFQSSVLQIAVSLVVVLVSAGLQAWDNQQVREFYYEGGGQDMLARKSLLGSLWMYINFINMFISILRLTGSRN